MKLTIYHNPRCSKSRKALELIEEKGFTPEIIDYLSAPPDGPTLRRIAAMLGVPVIELLRPGEDDYAALTANGSIRDDHTLASGLKNFPRALERPIVVDEEGGRAVIGRPPENVLDLLNL